MLILSWFLAQDIKKSAFCAAEWWSVVDPVTLLLACGSPRGCTLGEGT